MAAPKKSSVRRGTGQSSELFIGVITPALSGPQALARFEWFLADAIEPLAAEIFRRRVELP